MDPAPKAAEGTPRLRAFAEGGAMVPLGGVTPAVTAKLASSARLLTGRPFTRAITVPSGIPAESKKPPGSTLVTYTPSFRRYCCFMRSVSGVIW